MVMNCPQCGAVVVVGQAHCSCGQYLPRVRPESDIPGEFYTRLENQVEKSGKDNFRRGLLLVLALLPWAWNHRYDDLLYGDLPT